MIKLRPLIKPPSSSGPGRGPLKAQTAVRVRLGAPLYRHNTIMRWCAQALSLRIGVTPILPDLNEFISTEETAKKVKYLVEHVRCEALDSYMKRTASMTKHDPRRNK
jgi:hypothetical protein